MRAHEGDLNGKCFTPLALVGYEMIIANSEFRASFAQRAFGECSCRNLELCEKRNGWRV